LGILPLEQAKQLIEDFVRSMVFFGKDYISKLASSFTCWWDQNIKISTTFKYHARGSETFEFFCNNICVVDNGYGTIFVIVSNDLLQRGTVRRRQFSEA